MDEREIVLAAVQILDPVAREAFLNEKCAENAALRQRVDALIAAQSQTGPFTDEPATLTDAPPRSEIRTQLQSLDLESTGNFFPLNPVENNPDSTNLIAGRYRLLSRIGEGGMGVVWKAEQLHPVKRFVALKLINSTRLSAHILARFEIERQALAVMDHPHIAKVFDAGTHHQQPFFVMELVQGVPLTNYCDDHRLTIPERLNLFRDICLAIQHAHQKGVIHRDLKPGNILVEEVNGKANPKLIDFGLAKRFSEERLNDVSNLTEFGALLGTPLYMSPEQANPEGGVDVDTRADIYSLGVILYELLTGTTPIMRSHFQRAAMYELMRLIREVEPETPSSRISSHEGTPSAAAMRNIEPKKLSSLLKGDIDWIVMKALRKEREQRYESAASFAEDVARFLRDEPVSASPPSARYRFKKFIKRNKGQVLAACLVMLTLLIGIAGTSWQAYQANQARNKERERAEKESVANALAQKRLQQLQAGNDLISTIFEGVDPETEQKQGKSLRDLLQIKILAVGNRIAGDSVGDPLDVAALQHRLGVALLGLGHADTALPLLQAAFKIRDEHLGLDNPNTLATQYRIAAAHLHKEETRQLARSLFYENLERKQRILGPQHAETLLTMDRLVEIERNAGSRVTAIKLYEEIHRLRKLSLGEDHEETLQCLTNLSHYLQDTNNISLAIPLQEEHLKLATNKFGNENIITIVSTHALATFYLEAREYIKAVSLFEQTYQYNLKVNGKNHHETWGSMFNLALTYRESGQFEKAIPICEELLKLRQAMPDDINAILETQYCLALCYRKLNRDSSAFPLFLEIATYHEKTMFQDLDPGYSSSILQNLVDIFELNYRYDEAYKWRGRLTLIQNPDSVEYARILLGNVRNRLKAGATADAETEARICLKIHEDLFQKGSFKIRPLEVAEAKALLGAALIDLAQFVVAEPLLLAANSTIRKYEKDLPVETRLKTISEMNWWMIKLYTEWGKPDQADIWIRQIPVELLPAPRRREP